MRPALLALLLFVVSGCHAAQHLRVDVYRGATVSPDGLPAIERLGGIVARVLVSAENACTTAQSVSADSGAVSKALSAEGPAVVDAAAAKKLLSAWKGYVASLDKPSATPNKGASDALEEAERAATAGNAFAVLTKRAELADLSEVHSARGRCRGAADCKPAAKLSEARLKALSEALDALAADPTKIDWQPKGTTLAQEWVQSLKRIEELPRQCNANLQELRTAINSFRGKLAAFQSRGTEQPSPRYDECYRAWEEVMARGWLISSTISSQLNHETVKKLRGRLELLAADTGTTISPDAHANADSAVKILARIVDARVTLDHELEKGLRANFRSTDPNIKTITDPEHEDEWEGLAVDELHVAGDGTTQFVIVQDSPIVYRLKQLRADPTAAVELGLSVAEVGLDILSTYLLGGEILDGSGEGDTGNGGAEPTLSEDDLKALEAELATQRTQLAGELRKEIAAIPKDGKVSTEALARIRGILRGHGDRLSRIRKRAPEASGAQGATDKKEEGK